MKISAVKEIYFSPTGNTRKVTELLAKSFELPVQEIDLSDKEGAFHECCFSEEDICIIGVPSFGGRVPETAVKSLSAMKAANTPAILVSTYGNRAYEDTLLELKETVKACGFVPIAAAAAVTEHSIMHAYGAGRPDKEDREDLEQFAARIKKVTECGEPVEVEVPGTKPFREYHGIPLKPKANSKCRGCGLCVSKCPTGAIPAENPKLTDDLACISCMRCMKICPNEARKLNPVFLFGATEKLKKVCSERKGNEFFLNM